MAVINTNFASLNAQRNLKQSESALNTSLQRLSSGLRVNSAKDDAAGLAIATRLEAQNRGNTVALRNTNDAISMLQITDGSMATATTQLQRMRELATQSANATNGSTDRANLKAEFDELAAEMNKTLSGAKFNDQTLLDGKKVTFHVGAGTADTRDVELTTDFAAAAFLATQDISTVAGATGAMTAIDTALDSINTGRAKVGAYLSRFDSISSELSTKIENTEAAKSRIMDTDFAAETAKMTRNQILQQAGTAMLAQANQLPNTVMSLLRG